MIVYVLQHSREVGDDEEDIKLIGVFSSEEKGQEAIETLRGKPGFSQYLDGFSLDRYELDHVWWSDGFVTIPREGSNDGDP